MNTFFSVPKIITFKLRNGVSACAHDTRNIIINRTASVIITIVYTSQAEREPSAYIAIGRVKKKQNPRRF